MDESFEILLNSAKNIASVDVDTFEKIELTNKTSEILEYEVKNALSATEIFDAEREANPVYRIYGRVEYLSLLNGLKQNYKYLSDFFLQQTTNIKNIFNSFDFYLVRPASSGYTNIMNGTGTTIYWTRFFEVIATPQDFELYNAGFTTNVYGDQVYAFNFNKDFDVTTYVDNFGFPPTELYLYAIYKVEELGQISPRSETMSGTTWSWGNQGLVETKSPALYNPSFPFAVGDMILGDLIEYGKSIFLQSEVAEQKYYIKTPYSGTTAPIARSLIWKYNPFIPFKLRYFSESLSRANTGTTSYAQSISIPYYATSIGNGNYVWRDILPQGYFDPLTDQGVDYPFVNKKRYLFAPIVLEISPDLNDAGTLDAFNEIRYPSPTILNTKPISDLNDIGKPCLL
jgi:hypothetical protein